MIAHEVPRDAVVVQARRLRRSLPLLAGRRMRAAAGVRRQQPPRAGLPHRRTRHPTSDPVAAGRCRAARRWMFRWLLQRGSRYRRTPVTARPRTHPARQPRTAPASTASTWPGAAATTGFQCSTLTVPLDYSRPSGATIGIAVIRKPPPDSARGLADHQPRWPGESGVDFVEQDAIAFSQLTDHYDLVSFDPRGVGRSHPVRCLTSAQLDTFINTNPDPTTPTQSAAGRAGQAFAEGLLRQERQLPRARRHDRPGPRHGRAACRAGRQPSSRYYGASYGTYLGAKYAQLFPTQIRAMVLDGALTRTVRDRREPGAGQRFRDRPARLPDCLCTSGAQLSARIDRRRPRQSTLHAFEARITRTRSPSARGRSGPASSSRGSPAGCTHRPTGRSFGQAIGQAMQGNGAGMLAFADCLTQRQPDGSYTNLIESNLAINCIDRPWPRTVASYVQAAPHLRQHRARLRRGDRVRHRCRVRSGRCPRSRARIRCARRARRRSSSSAPPATRPRRMCGRRRWRGSCRPACCSPTKATGTRPYLRHDSCVDATVSSYMMT